MNWESSGAGKVYSDMRMQLSQQTLMERVVLGIGPSNDELFKNNDGTFKPIDEWPGVECMEGKVLWVSWSNMFSGIGALDFRWLPESVSRVVADNLSVQCVIDLSELPSSMLILSLRNTPILGKVGFDRLPHGIIYLDLSGAGIVGRVDLSLIPPTLHLIDLSHNLLEGDVDWSTIPRTLQSLTLAGNRLTGAYDYNLVSFLDHFDASSNFFTWASDAGDVCFGHESIHLCEGTSEIVYAGNYRVPLPIEIQSSLDPHIDSGKMKTADNDDILDLSPRLLRMHLQSNAEN